jgi:hypothetical protein
MSDFSPLGRVLANLKMTEVDNDFGYFFRGKRDGLISFDKKMGWATFWASFAQTHPVALDACDKRKGFYCFNFVLCLVCLLSRLPGSKQTFFAKTNRMVWG